LLGDSLAVTRGRYLFLLAHLCHVSPPVVDDLRVSDFAGLLHGIREYQKEHQKAGTPPPGAR
jgi:hypothetical protein